jgi:hypothetical protein
MKELPIDLALGTGISFFMSSRINYLPLAINKILLQSQKLSATFAPTGNYLGSGIT